MVVAERALARLVAEVIVELGLRRRLDHPAGELGDEPAGAGDLLGVEAAERLLRVGVSIRPSRRSRAPGSRGGGPHDARRVFGWVPFVFCHRIEVEVNGATAAEQVSACATIPGRPLVARIRPCPADAVAGFGLDTAAAPFGEGQNSVEICAEDFGTDGVNRTCESRLVRVHNDGPGPPIGLHVAGGDGTVLLRFEYPQRAGARLRRPDG